VEKPTEFIGLVSLYSLGAGRLELPEDLTLPHAAATTILTVELAYTLLPKAWGKRYAAEAVNAVFESCKQARSFWAPLSKLYVRAIVNQGNPASMRVMDKIGMEKRGIYVWTGSPIFLAGDWRERDDLHIYGKHLVE
jgi:RimJ/RimL family protein N-acetyltransferase